MKKLKDANEALEVVKTGGKLYYMVNGSYMEANDKNPFNSPEVEFYRIYNELEAADDMFETIKDEMLKDCARSGGGVYTARQWFYEGWNAHAEYIENIKSNKAF